MGREGEEELRLKATLGLIPKSEGTSQKSNNKNLQQEEAERGGSDASPAGPLWFTASLRPGRVPCSGANPFLGSAGAKGPSPPKRGFLTPHRTPVGPREAEEEGGGSSRRGSFPFPALHPRSVSPSSFPSHCRGREMPVGLEFPSKLCLLCRDSPLPLSVSLGQAWGKPNKQK